MTFAFRRDKEDTWEMRSIDQELEHAGAESWRLGPGGGRTGEHKRKSHADRTQREELGASNLDDVIPSVTDDNMACNVVLNLAQRGGSSAAWVPYGP
jgi:hypothetical protein